MGESAFSGPLVCEECERSSRDEAVQLRVMRWRVYLSSDDETVTYCQECAERELSFSRRREDLASVAAGDECEPLTAVLLLDPFCAELPPFPH